MTAERQDRRSASHFSVFGLRFSVLCFWFVVLGFSSRRSIENHRAITETKNIIWRSKRLMPKAKELTAKQRDALLTTLKARFEAHMHRHAGLEWSAVKARVLSNSARLWSLNEMEQSGGEPDVVASDKRTGEYIFVDCSAQSPKGRR